MVAGGFGDFHTAQHARQLFDSCVVVQSLDTGVGGVVPLNLVHLPVLVPLAGYLGLVGDSRHLGVPAKFAQQAADDLGHATTDTHVYFIEYQTRYRQVAGANNLDSQAYP